MIRQLKNIYKIILKSLHRLSVETSFRKNRSALQLKLKHQVTTCKLELIVISQVVHLGDIVACEPIVRQVRNENTEAFIVFALHRNFQELVDKHPDIDHVLPLACISEWARFAGTGIFDKIIDLNIYGRTCEICGVPWYKPDGNRGITVSNYFKFGSLLDAYCKSGGVNIPKDGPVINPGEGSMTFVDNLNIPDKFIVLHAGSNEKDRELPVESLKIVVDHINNIWGLPVLEIGLKQIVISLDDKINRSFCGQLSILQSAEIIRRSTLYLGSDSGPAHLASATGAYGIIALGHYRSFRRYMPYSGDYANGNRCELLYHDGPVAEMSVQQIIQAIDRRLSIVIGKRE